MPSAENALRFVHISDTHINPDTHYNIEHAPHTPIECAKKLVQIVNDLPFTPDFILHTGDVAYDPHPEIYPDIKAIFDDLKAPVHYLVGNHDDSRGLQKVLLGRSEDEIKDYLFYDFEVKGVHIVCLDSNGPHEPTHPSGNITQEQLDWLNEICASDDERPLVIATHHNVIPVNVPWLDTWMRTENGAEFHAIVRQARDRLCGVFFGHIHQNISTLRDGVHYVSATSPWYRLYSYPAPDNTRHSSDESAVSGFNVVTIFDGTTAIRQHHFGVD